MKPVKVFKSGANVASVFLNEYGYTVNLHRRFQRQESQEWESTSTFREGDLAQAALLLKLATDYVAEQGGFIQRSAQRNEAEQAPAVNSAGENSSQVETAT